MPPAVWFAYSPNSEERCRRMVTPASIRSMKQAAFGSDMAGG